MLQKQYCTTAIDISSRGGVEATKSKVLEAIDASCNCCCYLAVRRSTLLLNALKLCYALSRVLCYTPYAILAILVVSSLQVHVIDDHPASISGQPSKCSLHRQ